MSGATPELSWIRIARSYLGLREIPGSKHHPKILQWWRDIKASWFTDDETPWCGAFVGGVLAEDGKPVVKEAARALSWSSYGVRLARPAYGCIAVKTRKGGGHVGFVVGRDQRGNLMILGGNQNDAVTISPFREADFVAFRWPSVYPAINRFQLPLLSSDGKAVTEA
jgi:uncharacterized protein (TIGR02594 family)